MSGIYAILFILNPNASISPCFTSRGSTKISPLVPFNLKLSFLSFIVLEIKIGGYLVPFSCSKRYLNDILIRFKVS